MKQESLRETGTPCPRCRRRQQQAHRDRLCRVCEGEYQKRRGTLALSRWRLAGFFLVMPLIAITWNAPSMFASWNPGFALGHSWLLLLGIFAGVYLSKQLTAARVLLFRHRFEQELGAGAAH